MIAAGGVVVGETTPSDADDENDMSVALLINYRGFKAFFGGDIHAHTEEKIAQRDLVLDVDSIKAITTDHTPVSSVAFMNDLKPTVIVLSNGNDANYMHPRLVSLQTYAGLVPATTVFQVNKCFRPAPCANVPDAQIADPETTDTDGTILTTVTGTSNTYTLAYGTTTRTFTIKAPITPTPLAPATPGHRHHQTAPQSRWRGRTAGVGHDSEQGVSGRQPLWLEAGRSQWRDVEPDGIDCPEPVPHLQAERAGDESEQCGG